MADYTPPAWNAVQLSFGADSDPQSPTSVQLDFDAAGATRGTQGLAWSVCGHGSQGTSWNLRKRRTQGVSWELEPADVPGAQANLALGGAEQYVPPAGSAVLLALGSRELRAVGLAWGIGAHGFAGLAWEIQTLTYLRRSQGLEWRIAGGTRQTLEWELAALPPVLPGLYCLRSAPHRGTAQSLRPEAREGFGAPPRLRRLAGLPWGGAGQLRRQLRSPWGTPPRVRMENAQPWGSTAEQLRRLLALAFSSPESVRSERAAPWTGTEQLSRQLRDGFYSPEHLQAQRFDAWESGERLQAERALAFASPTRLRPQKEFPWGSAHLIRWSERWRKELRQSFLWERLGRPPEGNPYQPPAGSAARLEIRCPLLDWPGYGVWVFLRENPCSPGALKRKAWFLMNSLSVVRLPERTPVPALGASLSTDFDSWAWGIQLTLPDREALALVSPVGGAPAEVEVTVNGHAWTALVESYEERRQFGKSGFTVSGRSRSAYLAAPYAAARSYEETEALQAQALAAAEITGSGWTLSWEALDWLVPAGAFAYAQKTPMEAIAQIAAAIGARIQTHPADDLLRVLCRYPVAPWGWAAATPDKTLSDNLVTSLGLRWEERPSWNGVYVSGQSQGVLVQVKRTGSDGTPCAPMIVDPLITAVAAARERGLVELAAGGKQASVTIELPLLAYPEEPGLLLPGQLVEVDDGVDLWRGLVTSVSVQAGRPTVRQTVDLERHY